jgi:hypothetical protein
VINIDAATPVAVTAAAAGDTSAEVAFPAINATDAVTGSPRIECTGEFEAKSVKFLAGEAAKAVFPVGTTTTVTCTASDDAGNASPAASFNVTVCAFGFTYAQGACAGARPARRRAAAAAGAPGRAAGGGAR